MVDTVGILTEDWAPLRKRSGKVPMSQQKKPVFSMEMDVRWGDMDAMGHVNNTVYFRYMEQARVSWLESLHGSITDLTTGPVIVNARCTFLVPILYPERIVVEVACGPPGRSSFDTYYEIRPAGKPEPLYAEGQSKVVWIGHAAGRSVPVPDAIRALIET
ncbi:MAG: acyl-CoA thioesterase [Proteobacteria bacterium]|nr:MAG: acyl-CoA thioesterase [Pseudomonadota bacterium]